MCNSLILCSTFFMTIVVFVANKQPCSANVLPHMPNIKSGEIWLPRELGRFHLKDAGFIEVYETTPSIRTDANRNATVYADQYNLYITPFNAGILFGCNFILNLIRNVSGRVISLNTSIKVLQLHFSCHVRSRSSISHSIPRKPLG